MGNAEFVVEEDGEEGGGGAHDAAGYGFGERAVVGGLEDGNGVYVARE